MADKKKAAVESAAPAADKKKALETAMAQIEKAYGKGSIMRLGDNADIVVEADSTAAFFLSAMCVLLLSRRAGRCPPL